MIQLKYKCDGCGGKITFHYEIICELCKNVTKLCIVCSFKSFSTGDPCESCIRDEKLRKLLI